jgi:hypothetical protein
MGGLGINRRIILNLTFIDVWGILSGILWLWVGDGVQLV